MFTSDVLSPVHSVSWSAHSVSRPMPLSRGSTVAAQLRWFPMTGSSQCHRRPQCLQNFEPRLGHAWRSGPAHTQGVSRTQLVCRVQVSPISCAKFHVDCTVNNMKNPRCATVLSIRYVGLLFVILISFMYDMYFAVIVIWLCICLDPWSIKKLLLVSAFISGVFRPSEKSHPASPKEGSLLIMSISTVRDGQKIKSQMLGYISKLMWFPVRGPRKMHAKLGRIESLKVQYYIVHLLPIKWSYLHLSLSKIEGTCVLVRGGWGCEVSCSGHHRPRGKTTTGSALDGAVFDITQILAYLVHNMSRSQLYLGFGHFGWLPFFLVNNILAGLWLNCISSVEITLFLLADILLQHRDLFQC